MPDTLTIDTGIGRLTFRKADHEPVTDWSPRIVISIPVEGEEPGPHGQPVPHINHLLTYDQFVKVIQCGIATLEDIKLHKQQGS